MAITVTLPVGTVWGPGIQFDFSSSFIGPFPIGTHWQYSISSLASPETALVGSRKASQQSRETGVIGSPINDWPVITPPAAAAPEGAQARVIINVLPPTGPVIDETSFEVTWAPTSAVYSLVQSTPAGGHDPMLDTILAAVQKQAIATP